MVRKVKKIKGKPKTDKPKIVKTKKTRPIQQPKSTLKYPCWTCVNTDRQGRGFTQTFTPIAPQASQPINIYNMIKEPTVEPVKLEPLGDTVKAKPSQVPKVPKVPRIPTAIASSRPILFKDPYEYDDFSDNFSVTDAGFATPKPKRAYRRKTEAEKEAERNRPRRKYTKRTEKKEPEIMQMDDPKI